MDKWIGELFLDHFTSCTILLSGAALYYKEGSIHMITQT